MTNLQEALTLLEGQLGEFDNIKLLLGGREDMTCDEVGREILAIAKDVTSGKVVPTSGPDESAFKACSIAA